MGINYSPKIVTDGLVLCLDAGNPLSYPGSGNTWYDLKGSYNATVAGGSPAYSSINGGVFTFNGTSDYFLIPDPGSLGNFTVSCWAYPLLASSGSSPSIIASVFPSKVNFMIAYGNNNTVVAGIYNGVWTDLGSVSTAGGWQCFSYTYNGSQTSLFRNATVIRSLSTTIAAQSSGSGIRIGRRWDLADYWNGYISSVQIYNRALSSDEITQNYNATKGRFGL
jgi:hypothetical protein